MLRVILLRDPPRVVEQPDFPRDLPVIRRDARLLSLRKKIALGVLCASAGYLMLVLLELIAGRSLSAALLNSEALLSIPGGLVAFGIILRLMSKADSPKPGD